MNGYQKGQEPQVENVATETPKAEVRKPALRIEELEVRVAPNAFWGD